MVQKVKKKLERARKWNKLQAFGAIMLFVVACVNLYFDRVDIAFWQLILGWYCILLYRENVREYTLFKEYFECLDNNEFFYDYNRLLRAQIEMLEGKLSKEAFEKKAFEFNDKHHVLNANDCKDCADLPTCGGLQQ